MPLCMCAHTLPKILVPKEICFSETFLLMSKYNNSVFNHFLFKSILRRITLTIITINFVAIEFCYRIDFTDSGIFLCNFSLYCSVLLLPPQFCGNTTYLCKELLLNFWSDRAFRVYHDTISSLKLILYIFLLRIPYVPFFFATLCL